MNESGLYQSQADALGELSTYDNHPADIGDELFERSKDHAIKDLFARQLDAIDTALARISDGSYGLCENCGREIPLERLEVLPTATRCVNCQQLQDQALKQSGPYAGDVIVSDHFRHLFDDGKVLSGRETAGYDGEDAWQEVERYGTSSTPKDEPDIAGYKEALLQPDNLMNAAESIELVPDEDDDSRPMLE